MGTFRGKAHLPGVDEEWNIELEKAARERAQAILGMLGH